MNGCLVPGSFDPITNGHLDIIKRAARLFDGVVVGILDNVRKTAMFPLKDRIAMAEGAVADLPGVRVVSWDGLMVDLLRDLGLETTVRGVRNGADLDAEQQLAALNRKLFSRCETVLLPADPGLQTVSSTAVRELIAFGADIAPFVPHSVLDCMREEKHENF